MPICPHDGHYDGEPQEEYCADHGVPWFDHCSTCGAEWAFIDSAYSDSSGQARDFCAGCGMPGPWLTRDQLIRWIRDMIQADRDIPNATRIDLLAAMERLRTMDANDTKAVAGWEQVRKLSPKV
jgi:hypothetical protein